MVLLLLLGTTKIYLLDSMEITMVTSMVLLLQMEATASLLHVEMLKEKPLKVSIL
jgi:hypothetical protein